MKTIDIFCASQAATTTMDSNTPSSSSSGSGGRAIDRHNPIIQDQKRLTKTPLTPPSPNNKTTKTSKNNTNDQKRKSTSFADENENKHDHQQTVTNNNNKNVVKKQGSAGGVLLGWGCTKPSGFISPATSSRFLLADKSLSDQFDPLLNKHVVLPPQQPLVQLEKTRKSFSDRFFKNKNDQVSQSALPVINVNANKRKDEVLMQSVLPVINVVSKKKDEGGHDLPSSPLTTPRSSSSISSRSSEQQEVVLRVSLHCRGCEKKMRKHISKMEGVTSFNIDFLAKKVTVVGDITPLAVLTSVSKVKNAKLLTPTAISTPHVPPTQSDSNLSEVKKQLGL